MMGRRNRRRGMMVGQDYKPMRRWRSIHTAVWLIGLAILALKGWWWPGILVLVAVSALVEAVLPRENADIAGNEEDEEFESGGQAALSQGKPIAAGQAASQPAVQASSGARLDLLPTNCPRCGAPLHGVDAKWTSDRSADCPFCGSHLPMSAR
jgi:DNA-directed RNA polymerase subunit RPC12/RpoP